jgi:hypothetical protein
MQLCAIVTKADLVAVIEDLTPLRVEISRRPRRAVSLGRPRHVELVPGAGLRVRGEARFTWDAYALSIPVTLRAWQVLLAPAVVSREGRSVLAFEPSIEVIDIENVPGLVEEAITHAINEGLGAKRARLVWDFTKTLSFSKDLSERTSPGITFGVAPRGASVEVTAAEVRLTMSLEATVSRSEPRAARARHSPAA